MRLEKKKRQIAIFMIIVIAFFLLLIVEYNEKSISEDVSQREETLIEEKIAALLETLDGVSRVDVMVTLDTYGNGKGSPNVRGVSIVCHGKRREDLKAKIVMLVSTALGISSDKIFVSFT